nr:hypothetical protein [Tanacetum cinerariifolium]
STASPFELDSDADEPCVASPNSSNIPQLTSINDDVVAFDSPIYYSCDEDDFSPLDEAIASDQRLQISPSRPQTSDAVLHISQRVCTAYIHLLSIILEKVMKRSFKYLTRPVILPCLERIKKLEKMVEELETKPARIPEEKEQTLERSMERIKVFGGEAYTDNEDSLPVMLANARNSGWSAISSLSCMPIVAVELYREHLADARETKEELASRGKKFMSRRNIRNVIKQMVQRMRRMDVVFDGAFGGVGDEEVVLGEGVMVTSSSLEMLTNSCLGRIMVSLIFLKGLEEEAFEEFMIKLFEEDDKMSNKYGLFN